MNWIEAGSPVCVNEHGPDHRHITGIGLVYASETWPLEGMCSSSGRFLGEIQLHRTANCFWVEEDEPLCKQHLSVQKEGLRWRKNGKLGTNSMGEYLRCTSGVSAKLHHSN